MKLPKLSHPTFTLTLPSTKQEIEFRPFLVREEKILLVAQSSNEPADIVRAIKQVVTNCIVTPDIIVDSFTSFDLEYFFVKLRARSVNNVITLTYKDREDGKNYDVEVNLDEIEIVSSHVPDTVNVGPDATLKLRYPRINMIDQLDKASDEVDFNFAIMVACLDSLYVGDECYSFDAHTRQEVVAFLEDLDAKTYESIQRFIESMPRLEHTVGYTNSSGKYVEIKLSTLTDFFTLG
jgi:T4 bacteriophage base plate protein